MEGKAMVSNQSTTVLHPGAEDPARKFGLAPRLGDLKGMTVGIIDNHKRNVDVYVAELGRVLQDEYGVAKVVTYRKVSQSIPTPADVLDSLAAECDAIVHAVAD